MDFAGNELIKAADFLHIESIAESLNPSKENFLGKINRVKIA